jgi:2-polyprenyl-6-methoxyphenol hydroxylase-like FAD-dependent oxidoreductase
MGLLDALELKTRQYPISGVAFVDRQGRTRARLDVRRFRKMLHNRYLNLMRGDLEDVLYAAIQAEVPVHFHTTLTRLQVQDDGVDTVWSDGSQHKFDLVIGAGGIHSGVRNLVWGDERQFTKFLGFYVACSVIDNFLGREGVFYGHLEPNVQISVYSLGDNRLATFFAFKSELLDVHGRAAALQVLKQRLGQCGWITPQLIEATEQAPHVFFDAVAQISLDTWYKDRVALVGDACQCLTLLAGQGASMAMAGAYLLADELRQAEGDYRLAFPAYEEKLKPEIDRRQQEARNLTNTFVPRNRFEIAMSHFLLNAAFWPGISSLFAKQIGAKSLIK